VAIRLSTVSRKLAVVEVVDTMAHTPYQAQGVQVVEERLIILKTHKVL
jgi:hypothetical protein